MQVVEDYNQSLSENRALKAWGVCVAASLFFFYELIQGNMFASIADNIMQDFGIQVNKMTYLSTIYYASNVIFLFFAGMLLDRLSTKKMMLFAMLLCVLSTFVLAHTTSFSIALMCRFITGIGSAFCFLGPIRIASRWFPSERMAFVTGVIVTIAMSGGWVAQYPLTKLVSYCGWRHAVSLVGWFGVVLLLLMLFGVKDSPRTWLRPEKYESLMTIAKKAYLNLQSMRAALYTSLMNMAVAVFGAMMGSLYLIERLGVSKEEASFVNSMLFLGIIFGGPFMGYLSDRIGLRILPMKLGALLSILTILAIMYLPLSMTAMVGLFFLLGFFTASQVISYAFVAESCPPTMAATAVSLISILTQGGYVVYQNIFSHILQGLHEMHRVNGVPVYSLHSYQVAAIMFPVGLCLAFLVLFGLNETYCQREVLS